MLAFDSGVSADELFRLTGGNPFFVTEVVRAGVGEVPPSARDAVLARAGRLSDGARRVLETAALVGSRVEPRLVAAISETPDAAIDELVATGLLVGDGGTLRFRHEIARLAAGESVPAHRRASLHAEILRAQIALGTADDAAMAFHAEAAGDGPAVVQCARRAAVRAAELASHREAAAQYERALRHVPDTDLVTRAQLSTDLAEELSLIFGDERAVSVQRRALDLWRALGDALHEGDALIRLSVLVSSVGDGLQAASLGAAGLALLEPLGDTPQLAFAYAKESGRQMVIGDNLRALELARKAAGLAERLGMTDVLSHALNTEACVTGAEDWEAIMLRALDVALTHGHQADAARAYHNLHGSYTVHRAAAGAIRAFTDGIAYCDEHDLGTYAISMRGGHSALMSALGRWEEATALGMQVMAEVSAGSYNRLCASIGLAIVRMRRGLPHVWEPLDEVLAVGLAGAQPQNAVPLLNARAEAHWLEGRPEDARREAERAAEELGSDTDPFRRGEVGRWLRRLGSDVVVSGTVAEPYLRELAGDWAAASRWWDERGYRYDAALSLVDSGEESALLEALEILRDLGAEATVRLVVQRLREMGVRSIPTGARPTTKAHAAGLTAREQEVLDLICAGRTNAQIATALFISTKTVDHHVSAVLAKLGASSRTAAAQVAARLGLGPVGAAAGEHGEPFPIPG
jgi:DNA-binding CsgD family transcriptional regulator/tetratricopeptide (TPR) repeat protein